MRNAAKEIIAELDKNATRMSYKKFRTLMREHYMLPEKHYRDALEDLDPFSLVMDEEEE